MGRLYGKVNIIGVMKCNKMNQNKMNRTCFEIKRNTEEEGHNKMETGL